jgi:hypothetical protein
MLSFFVFHVGHVAKSSLYETLFHCNILSKHHHHHPKVYEAVHALSITTGDTENEEKGEELDGSFGSMEVGCFHFLCSLLTYALLAGFVCFT